MAYPDERKKDKRVYLLNALNNKSDMARCVEQYRKRTYIQYFHHEAATTALKDLATRT